MTCINRLTARLSFWMLLYLVCPLPVQAMPGLPYESIPGQMQVEQSDKNRVPQVEFQTEPFWGSILLKEIDYQGEGQFPLEFTRYLASPQHPGSDTCNTFANLDSGMWVHSYSSCLIDHFNLGGPASNRTITVCTMGICTMFEETLKPRLKYVRDTLVRNGKINGVTYPWVYTQFKTGIREAYDEIYPTEHRLIARFDRSGIEHRLTYEVDPMPPVIPTNYIDRRLKYVTHIPTGRKLAFDYNSNDFRVNYKLTLMTDPQNNRYSYFQDTSPDTISFPPALLGLSALQRNYTFLGKICHGIILPGQAPHPSWLNGYLSSISELGSNQFSMEFMGGQDSKFCDFTNSFGAWYTKIIKPGHNNQPLISTHYLTPSFYINQTHPQDGNGGYKPYILADQFADTDTSTYRSLNTDRFFKNINGLRWDEGYAIWRPTSTTPRCADCKDDYASYTWDTTTGDLLTRTDYLGRVTKFTNDARGLPLTETEAFGTAEARTTTRTWDSRFPLMTSEIRGTVAKEWRYNAFGHVVKEIVRPTSEALVSDSCPVGSLTCHQTVYGYTYNATNHVITRMVKYGPRTEGDNTITDYDPNGDLWKVTNAKGQIVDEVLAVNAHGQVTQRRDLNGRVTTTVYNNLRQPITETVTGGDVTKWDYTINGRLKTYTKPDGSVLAYTYNPAGSVKTVSQTVGGITDKVEYFRDSRGKILKTVAAKTGEADQTWKQTFDLAGRLDTASDGTNQWLSDYLYNANNLETRYCISSEICHLTGYTAIDQLNTKSYALMLAGGTLGAQKLLFDLGYDVAGRVNSVVDPGGVATGIINNEINQQTRQNSPDFGIRTSKFDLAGNETYRQDQDGNAATKLYDTLNRLYQTDYTDGGKLTQTWDVSTLGDTAVGNYPGRLGQRSRINTDAAGNITVTNDFVYNVRGDVTAAHQSITGLPKLITMTTYQPGLDDEAGKPDIITYPGGLQVNYTYGAHGKPTQVDAVLGGVTTNLAKNIVWQPLIRRLSSLTFGNGLGYERSRDAGGRINAIRLNDAAGTAIYAAGVLYDTRNRVKTYGGWDFDYDDLDHLSSQSTRDVANLQHWVLQHDLNGNLERQDSFDAAGALVRRDVLTYPTTNNRVAQETITPGPPADGTGGSNLPNAYDLSGFITQQGPVSYQYDDARQMKRYLRTGVNVRYVYDGARRRVLKSDTDGDTRFVYDQADHLIYEVNPDGSRRNYVWLGDIPLAVIDQNAAGAKIATYFIETDFANTPRFLRRASGDLTKPVWVWAFAPYGDWPANQNPDGDATPVTFNLRYPGQYYDAESKLHFNHTRYFQPRTGRYLQPDLIGLEGGINVYTYANGNPVMYMDPTGTFWDFLDFGFFAQSLFNFAQEPTTDNAVNLGLDTVGLAPGVPALGTIKRVADAADKAADVGKAAKEVGSYTNLHASGKTYSGKGTRERSQISARREEKLNNDTHIATEFRPAENNRDAFKAESRRLDNNGGVNGGNNYNRIDSPGKKYRIEDGEL
ncbi:MAG: RHS repeat-associated core domain-containing protein [Methyloglobulus sp.]|nr:RHS repeat-associated core domain-containing protein [Methyloglobulus sp.]